MELSQDKILFSESVEVTSSIKSPPSDEADVLKGLTECVRDQDAVEREITNQANNFMIVHEDERDQQRLSKTQISLEKFRTKKRIYERRLESSTNNPVANDRCLRELQRINDEIAGLESDITDIQTRIDERHQHIVGQNSSDNDTNCRIPNESEKEFLIRTGKITPFSQIFKKEASNLHDSLTDKLLSNGNPLKSPEHDVKAENRSHQNLRLPGFKTWSPEEEFSLRPRKKRKTNNTLYPADVQLSPCSEEYASQSAPSFDSDSEKGEIDGPRTSISNSLEKNTIDNARVDDIIDLTGIDDGNESIYQSRIKIWVKKRSAARTKKPQTPQKTQSMNDIEDDIIIPGEEEWFKPCPDAPDHYFNNDMKLPGDIYPALFDYQRTGVQWLWELYTQQVGGIVGDEMGLGKTIQIISFLAGLHYSKKLTKPVIIIAPATVLQQWVNEFHKWWPPLRVSILHSSGSGMINPRNEKITDDSLETYGLSKPRKSSKGSKKIVDQVVQQGHILITSYAGLQTFADILLPVEWGYAVLDEGHKIRNPNTTVTIYCKELKTPNRIIVSGTPMQNNLVELWSLFDFIFPMRLGTLVTFRKTFETPIKQGGYANSTNLQVLTATKCAEELKAAISPYLLQRLKVDVASDLPKKTEQVLFVKLTKTQRDAYESFLASKEMSFILKGTLKSLYGIDALKKICNHPDLLDHNLKNRPEYRWADPDKSGKMKIVENLLRLWKSFNHKTLLFCQGVQMLDILEHFIKSLDDYNYLRMDGSTNIKERQSLVDKFNKSSDLHVFLLTTKVGGLGVNLTGANRVLIFDPDWNPSTDVQARERAWRLGQKKEVTIYRLITAGTIEEKMYHRQIFKQFLTNKVLKDPKQRQTFQMKDLYDLFSLGSSDNDITETGQMFKGTEVKFHSICEKKDRNDTENPAHTIRLKPKKEDSSSEILKFSGIAGLEEYNIDPEKEILGSEEDRLMKGIFNGSGVQSALEHDQIVNGKMRITADYGILEREAKKVAAEAAAELRKAGEVARTLTPGTVTWTGDFGTAGKPTYFRQDSLGGLSPSLNRRNILAKRPRTSITENNGGAMIPKAREFKSLIKSFIKKQGGSVASQTLVNHFNRMCQNSQQTAEFKNSLEQVARLELGQNSRRRGMWFLKDGIK